MKNQIIIIMSVLLIGCSQYTGKNQIVNNNALDIQIQGDWELDSTVTEDNTIVQDYNKTYSFIDGKFFTIVGNDVHMSKYKLNGKIIDIFNKKKLIDSAEILKINKSTLVLQTGYYYYDIKTLYLSR